MPSVPLLMPSLTPIVLKINPTKSLSHTPCLMVFAKSFRCILQVLPSYPMLTTPTCAFFKSASVNPIPYNMACAAGCVGSCVIVLLYLFKASLPSPEKIGTGVGGFLDSDILYLLLFIQSSIFEILKATPLEATKVWDCNSGEAVTLFL